ncbi:MAG TPA: ATP-binding cassette domain-containing protein [Desulfotomaculum sp.]|nr:ATP-binding cassette domain-containing protein [Desulfotomaculum sp.]
MLKIEDLHVSYGEIHALKGVSLEVYSGEIVSLIGANGSGKTTLLKTISGLLRPQKGRIIYHGRELNKIAPYELITLGVAHVPEGRRIFGDMTVEERADPLRLDN